MLSLPSHRSVMYSAPVTGSTARSESPPPGPARPLVRLGGQPVASRRNTSLGSGSPSGAFTNTRPSLARAMPGSDALSEPGIGSGVPFAVDAVAMLVVVVVDVLEVLVELLEVVDVLV